MEIYSCPSANRFNVFGLDDGNLCCFKYHKYCKDVSSCIMKCIYSDLYDIKVSRFDIIRRLEVV